MAKKKKITEKYQIWIDVQKRFHLSHVCIQMARELGMNPKKFGKLANHKQEHWKAPLPDFIEGLYFKQFGKKRPDIVKTIGQLAKEQEKKKAERQRCNKLKKQNVAASTDDSNLTHRVRQANLAFLTTDKRRFFW